MYWISVYTITEEAQPTERVSCVRKPIAVAHCKRDSRRGFLRYPAYVILGGLRGRLAPLTTPCLLDSPAKHSNLHTYCARGGFRPVLKVLVLHIAAGGAYAGGDSTASATAALPG